MGNLLCPCLGPSGSPDELIPVNSPSRKSPIAGNSAPPTLLNQNTLGDETDCVSAAVPPNVVRVPRTSAGKRYHSDTHPCRAALSLSTVSLDEARSRNLLPCRVCLKEVPWTHDDAPSKDPVHLGTPDRRTDGTAARKTPTPPREPPVPYTGGRRSLSPPPTFDLGADNDGRSATDEIVLPWDQRINVDDVYGLMSKRQQRRTLPSELRVSVRKRFERNFNTDICLSCGALLQERDMGFCHKHALRDVNISAQRDTVWELTGRCDAYTGAQSVVKPHVDHVHEVQEWFNALVYAAVEFKDAALVTGGRTLERVMEPVGERLINGPVNLVVTGESLNISKGQVVKKYLQGFMGCTGSTSEILPLVEHCTGQVARRAVDEGHWCAIEERMAATCWSPQRGLLDRIDQLAESSPAHRREYTALADSMYLIVDKMDLAAKSR